MNGNKREKKSLVDGFNISIVEDHDKALADIYKEIGRKKLNFNNLTLIHFDSHPDLGIPSKLEADSIYDREKLDEFLSIENWILPAVYAGHINKIVWIKPKWATQIDTGKYDLIIGKDVKTGYIKCNCKETYFLTDMTYSNESNLVNKKEFLLYVCDFDTIINENDECLIDLFHKAISNKKINSSLNSGSLILDVDLDFFSTKDPFQQMFVNEADYELFKSIYKSISNLPNQTEINTSYESFLTDKLNRLNEIFDYLTGNSNEWKNTIIKKEDLDKLISIVHRDNLDIEIIHEYGSCLDDKPLPHHVSTIDEINEMFDKFVLFLNKYISNKIVPDLITIARSCEDDYCPHEQVDFIEQEFLLKLKSYFDTKLINSINKNY